MTSQLLVSEFEQVHIPYALGKETYEGRGSLTKYGRAVLSPVPACSLILISFTFNYSHKANVILAKQTPNSSLWLLCLSFMAVL